MRNERVLSEEWLDKMFDMVRQYFYIGIGCGLLMGSGIGLFVGARICNFG